MSKLTKAEKNQIILNESRGIQHPLYYVCTTKTGGVQVRKRKVPLSIEVKNESKPVEESEPHESKDIYETITNKEILEKMLSILENQVVSRDGNLNSVENERETQENKKFVENIQEQIERPPFTETKTETKTEPQKQNPYAVRRRGRVL